MSDQTESIIAPESVDEFAAAIRAHDRVQIVGARTKQPLYRPEGRTPLSTSRLTGIVEYQPSEFTFTARAGTPLNEIESVLAQRNQYLPFDPPLASQGATLGGTVATGLSGPGRFRYGGVRDFLLGIQCVNGDGQKIHAGGKVVKNAAGFDIPKLLVGSVGQFAAITELTFKVFPKPQHSLTGRVQYDSLGQVLDAVAILAGGPYELDAIEIELHSKTIVIRVRGPHTANSRLFDRVAEDLKTDVTRLDEEAAERYWSELAELAPSDGSASNTVVVKVPCTREAVQQLDAMNWDTENAPPRIHLSAAGAVAWAFVDENQLTQLHTELCKIETTALAVRGHCDRCVWGFREPQDIALRIKHAFDPTDRFPKLL